MTVVELVQGRPIITQRQRWGHYLVLIFGVIGLAIGLNLRNTVLNASAFYTDSRAGVSALYPQNWLLDTDGDYVFRVRDVIESGFKTTIQVSVHPVGAATESRNILDSLTLNRSQTLAAYEVLSREPFVLPDETMATSMTYTYVAAETNPFLQSIPQVILGIDVLTIKRGQAIIITFLTDAEQFDEKQAIFNQFLSNLEF